MACFILEGIVVGFTGADFDDVFYIVDENLTVAGIACVEGLLCGGHNELWRNFRNHDVNLYLREEVHAHFNTTVLTGFTELLATAHNIGDGHAGHAQSGHGVTQEWKTFFLADDGNLGELFPFAFCSGWLMKRERGKGVDIDAFALVGNGSARIGWEEVGIGRGQTVFGEVKTHDFFFGCNAKANGGVDELKDDGHSNGGIKSNGTHAKALDAQVGHAAAVEQTALGVKETIGHGPPNTVDAVHANGADRVINMELKVDAFYSKHDQDTSHKANDERAQGIDGGAWCGDGHKASQGGVHAHGYVGLAAAHPCEYHAGKGSGCWSDGGVGQNLRQLGAIGSCSAVKAVPAEPKDETAQGAQGEGVTSDGVYMDATAFVLGVLPKTRPQDGCTDESRNTTHHVNNTGTSKIYKA